MRLILSDYRKINNLTTKLYSGFITYVILAGMPESSHRESVARVLFNVIPSLALDWNDDDLA